MKTLSPSPCPLPRRGEGVWLPCNELQGINRFEKHDLLALNRYSVESRYPGDLEPYSLEEAMDAIAIAQKMAVVTQSCLRINS